MKCFSADVCTDSTCALLTDYHDSTCAFLIIMTVLVLF